MKSSYRSHPQGVRRIPWRSAVAVAAAASLAMAVGSATAEAEPDGRPRVITSPDAPEAIGPYSQGISTGSLAFLSGQLPIDPKTGTIPADATIEDQTRQVLRNLDAVLKADGMSLDNVVSPTVYVSDLDDFARFNAAYAEFFGSGAPPARATVEVARVPLDALRQADAAGDAHQRNAAALRVGERRHGVREAGPAGHQHDAGPAGRQRVAARHPPRAAFVAGVHETHTLRGAPVEDRVRMVAAQREDDLHPMRLQRPRNEPARVVHGSIVPDVPARARIGEASPRCGRVSFPERRGGGSR